MSSISTLKEILLDCLGTQKKRHLSQIKEEQREYFKGFLEKQNYLAHKGETLGEKDFKASASNLSSNGPTLPLAFLLQTQHVNEGDMFPYPILT